MTGATRARMARVLAPAAALGLAMVAAGCGADRDEPASPRATPEQPAAPARRPVPPPLRIPALRPGQTLVAAVQRRVPLRAAPGGRVLARVGPRTAFSSPQVLAVLGVEHGWARVLHPALPDHRGGWVAVRNVHLRAAAWSIVVDLSDRRAVLRRNGHTVKRFAVGVGAPGTPTPTGRFGVTDRLAADGSTSYYGCCVLALNGHQPHVAQGWKGGDRLAIHGTDRPSTIGQAATLGCLHADAATMRVLMGHVPLGATVVIRA